MASQADFEAALARVDTATSNISTVLTDLRNQIAGAGLPADVEANILSRLDQAATSLESMAGDPGDPVPDPEPVPDGGTPA